jgi:hypothetical protein
MTKAVRRERRKIISWRILTATSNNEERKTLLDFFINER